jgi:thiol:disulfide interchange protein
MRDFKYRRNRARDTLVAVLGLMLSAVAYAAGPAAPKMVGVLMYADWCNSCKVLDPRLQAVQPEFGQSDILFVRFDFTNERSAHQARLLAGALGVDALYAQNAGKTGYLALVDLATGQIVEKITKAHSEQQIRAIFRQASAK